MLRSITITTVLAFTCSGCGLLVSGTQTEVPVRSDPPGAEVWVDGEKVGTTPLRLRLAASEPHTLQVRAVGYQSRSYRLEPGVEATYVLFDIFPGMGVGVIVDLATQGWYELSPHELDVTLPDDPQYVPPSASDTPADGIPSPGESPLEGGDGLAAPPRHEA